MISVNAGRLVWCFFLRATPAQAPSRKGSSSLQNHTSLCWCQALFINTGFRGLSSSVPKESSEWNLQLTKTSSRHAGVRLKWALGALVHHKVQIISSFCAESFLACAKQKICLRRWFFGSLPLPPKLFAFVLHCHASISNRISLNVGSSTLPMAIKCSYYSQQFCIASFSLVTFSAALVCEFKSSDKFLVLCQNQVSQTLSFWVQSLNSTPQLFSAIHGGEFTASGKSHGFWFRATKQLYSCDRT